MWRATGLKKYVLLGNLGVKYHLFWNQKITDSINYKALWLNYIKLSIGTLLHKQDKCISLHTVFSKPGAVRGRGFFLTVKKNCKINSWQHFKEVWDEARSPKAGIYEFEPALLKVITRSLNPFKAGAQAFREYLVLGVACNSSTVTRVGYIEVLAAFEKITAL